jgi:hypothetical protein
VRDTTQHSEFLYNIVGFLGELAVGSRGFHDEPLEIAVLLKRGPCALDGGRDTFFDELVDFVCLRKTM